MAEKQIYIRAFAAASMTVALIVLPACYPAKRIPLSQEEAAPDYWADKKSRLQPHQKRAVLEALEGVRKKAAGGSSLEGLGISTLKEAVVLLEDTRASAPFIADVIEGRDSWADLRGEPYYWKLRYWCIDMAAYMNERNFAPILSSIVSGKDEKHELRIRAVKTLREIKAREELGKLFMETENSAVREELARALLYFD